MNKNMAYTLAAIMLLLTGALVQAWAAPNPADITSFERRSKPFVKIANEDGWFVCASRPVDKSTSITYFHCETTSNGEKENLFVLVRSLSKSLDMAWDYDSFKHGPLSQRVSLDLHDDKGNGIGVVLPLDEHREPGIGLRAGIGKTIAFATFRKEADPIFGVTFYDKKGGDYVFAASEENWWFRTTHKTGQVWPELRLHKEPDKLIAGFAITYCF